MWADCPTLPKPSNLCLYLVLLVSPICYVTAIVAIVA